MIRVKFKIKILFLLIPFLFTIAAILIVMMNYMFKMEKNTIDSVNKKHIILWWTPFIKHFEYTRLCNQITCFFTGNRSYRVHSNTKALLFYGSNIIANDMPVPRNLKHLWGLFHEESPKNVPYLMYDNALNIFNITSTFSQYSDFPLTSQYLESINSIIDRQYLISVNEKDEFQFNDGLAPIIYIQSICDTMSGRDAYIQELMKYIKIDSYGKCLHNKDLPISLTGSEYLNTINSYEFNLLISRYKFIIAYENSICDDYITEKFWRAITTGVIPIYFGAPNIESWLPNKGSAILIKNFQSVKELANYILYLNTNATEYNKYIKHKDKRNPISNRKLLRELDQRSYSNPDNTIYDFECYMCEKSVNGFSSKNTQKNIVHYNFNSNLIYPPNFNNSNTEWKTIMKQGKCEADVLEYFISQNKSYGKNEYYTEIGRRYDAGECFM